MTESILAGQQVMIAEKQLSDHVKGLLAKTVEELGGVMVDHVKLATIVLSNPSSPLFAATDMMHRYWKDNSGQDIILAPYHYLYAVRNAGKLFPVEELEPSAPIFIHPKTHEPLRIYVSVNIDHSPSSTEAGLTAVQNKADLQRQLEACGAIMEETRRGCDVGLFSISPAMAQSRKFANETKAMGKFVAGRDWAERCMSTGRIRWSIPSEHHESAQSDGTGDDLDSMAEDLTPVKANRPGRPTGGLRREYSAEEDDLLCRWLAAHKPEGSHLSRKTYEIMCAMEKRYPWVTGHSFQSWHQRFKNNPTAFGTRVAKYIRAEIDKDLKTAKERAKERESRPANKRARVDDEPHADQSMAKKSRAEAAAGTQSVVSHGPGPSSSSPAHLTPSNDKPVIAQRLPSRSPLDPDPFEKQDASSQAVAGPGPSSFAAAQSVNRHMLVTLSESSDDEPGGNVQDNSVVDTRGDSTKSPARVNDTTHIDARAGPDLVQPANAQGGGVDSIPPVLDEDDAAMDAALFPGTPLPTVNSLPAPESQRPITASPARVPSPPAEPQPETMMGAETQAMLQQHQAIKRLGGHTPLPVGEEHAHMTVAVHQGSPTGRVRLSMSVDGDAVVNIDIAGNREQTPQFTEEYVRHPGSARKLLLGGKGARIEEIHTSGGSRRRSSIKARPSLSAIRHTPDVVLRNTTPTHTSPLAPVSRLAAPVQPRPSTGTVQEGSAASAANKAKYRAWLLRMQAEYGKTPKEVVAIQDRLKLAASKAAGGAVVALGPNAIEAELKKLAQAG